MKAIQVTKYKSTELNPEFNSANTIDIEDKPFDSGAFGEVYFCNSINGVALQTPQVLKIFLDDGSGSAKRGYETINKLQEQIIIHNKFLKQKNEKPVEQVNALAALPQFSYEGILNGNKVVGYSANLLRKNKWLLFGDIFNEEDLAKRKKLRNNFYNLPIDHRLKMAYDLAEGFAHLGTMNFIYADLNPKNFFVSEKDGQLCLIDYEGGAVNDNPETFGKPGEWLAPEIQEQLLRNNSPIIKVDLNTDTWAVAIGIHFMLFNFHPLFFLKIRGRKEMQDYFKKHKWPDIDKTNANFRTELSGMYDWYIDKLNTQIPPELNRAFADTINRGYSNPNLRLSYRQWINAIKGLMLPPTILNFTADNSIIVDGIPVTLSWGVDKKTHTLLLDNGIGDVTSLSEIKVRPEKNTAYTLKAIGHFGEIVQTVDIKVFPTPQIQSLFIPAPQFAHHTQLSNLRIGKPDVNISINLDTTLLQSSTMQFVEATKEFKEIEPKYNSRVPNISNAFDYILKTIKQNFT